MRTIIVVLPVLLLIGLLCLPALAASLNDTTKVVIVSFQYRDGTVTPAGARVIYGHPPNYAAHRDYIADMAQKNGNVIGSYGIEDPRVLYSDEGAVLKNEVKFSVFLPYAATGDHVDLLDGHSKQKMATADITGAIAKFCDVHRDDPDCGGGGQPVFMYGAAILVILVILGAGAYLLLTRKKV